MKGEDRRDRPNRPAFETLEPRLLLNGMIEGQVWEDLNGDGIRDAGELGLNGWAVELVDQVTNTVVDTQVTADVDLDSSGTIDPMTESGLYTFTGLSSGRFLIRESAPTGWLQIGPADSGAAAELTLMDVLSYGDPGGEHLSRVDNIEISNDGRFLYAGHRDLPVFEINPETGELSLVQVLGDEEGSDWLDGAYGLTMSPDGLRMVTALSDERLAILDRDPTTGELSLAQLLSFNHGYLFAGVHSLAFSEDGQNLYLMTRGYNGPREVQTYTFDPVTGEAQETQRLILDLEEFNDITANAMRIAVSPLGDQVYATSRNGFLLAFDRDAATGDLTLRQFLRDGHDGISGLHMAKAISVADDGRHIYIDGDGGPLRFGRDRATGDLVFLGAEAVSHGEGAFVFSPDGLHIFANANGMLIHRRDPSSGTLTFEDALLPGSGDRQHLYDLEDIAVSTNGRFVCIASSNSVGSGNVAVYRRDLVAGAYTLDVEPDGIYQNLDFVNVQPVVVTGQVFDDLDADGLQDVGDIGANGRLVHLMAAGTGALIAVATTSDIDVDGSGTIDAATETGRFAFEGFAPGEYGVRLVPLRHWQQTAPLGDHVVAPASSESVGVIFGTSSLPGEIHGQIFNDLDGDGVRDAGEVGLDGWPVELIDHATGDILTTVSASVDSNGDGVIDPVTESGLYAFTNIPIADYDIRQIAPVGWVNTSPGPDGQVSYVETVAAAPVDSLSTLISDDGRFVYTAGTNPRIYQRDPVSGALSGGTAIEYLSFTRQMALSPDGRNLYAIGGPTYAGSGETLFIYDRDPDTGSLSLLDTIVGVESDISQMTWPREIVVSPDGRHVYLHGLVHYEAEGVIVMRRDVDTGLLEHVETLGTGQSFNYFGGGQRGIVISDDGQYVYTVNGDEQLTAYRRDPYTGRLTEFQTVRDDEGGVTGMNRPRAITLSPDGRSLYVAESREGRVVTFHRDVTTGQLTFVESLDLNGATDVTISPDGRFVFVPSYGDDSLKVLSRDTDTGQLTLMDVLTDGEDGVDGLNEALWTSVSPDGRHLYVSTRDSGDAGVAVFDLTAGGRQAASVQAGETVSGMDFGNIQTGAITGQVFVDTDGDGVRDVGETGLDGWAVQVIDSVDGHIISASTHSEDLDGDGLIDPATESGLFRIANLLPGQYEIRQIQRDGWLQTLPTLPAYSVVVQSGVEHVFDFGNDWLPGEIVGQFWSDLDGDGIEDAGDVGVNGAAIELFDLATGERLATTTTADLDLNGNGTIEAGETGAYRFSNVAPGVYEVRSPERANWQYTIPVARRDALAITQFVSDVLDEDERPYQVATSSDGGNVYVADPTADAVLVFDRDIRTGALTFRQAMNDGEGGVTNLGGVIALEVSEDGQNVYAASFTGLVVFARSSDTGELTYLHAITETEPGMPIGGFINLELSRDGRHVYAATSSTYRLATFERDVTDGSLVFANGLTTDDVADLPNQDVAVSADGAFACSVMSQYLALFSRDAATGQLTPLTTENFYLHGRGARRVAFHPDALQIYVTCGYEGDSLLVYDVDPVDGTLTLHQALLDDVDGVDGLDYAWALDVSADGRYVFASGVEDSGLTVFARDAVSGDLTHVETYHAGPGDLGGHNIQDVAVSPDGRHLYTAAINNYGVGVWSLGGVAYHEVAVTGEVHAGVDFGATPLASVSGQVFMDLNSDGILDADEPGVNDWTIELLALDTGLVLATTKTESLDLNGDGLIDRQTEMGLYELTPLPPGEYVVRHVLPSGWTETLPGAGSYTVVLSAGQHETLNFGNTIAPAEVHGQTFEDTNGNGQRDAGEPGMDGWTVELIDAATDDIIGRVITAGNDTNGDGLIDPETEAGLYDFTNLVPGDYLLRQVAQEGWTQTAPSQGTAQLTPIQQVPEGTGGLNGAASSALSPDGRQLYVTDNFGDALAIFQRNPYTGQLTLDQELRSAGPDAFTLVGNVIVSPDGLFVYLTEVDAFYVFQRDPATGDLTFLQTLRDGENGASLSYPRGQAISPDGSFIYVADEQFRGAVTVFRRDPASGLLSVEQVVEHDADGLDDFNAPYVIRTSPNGAHAFVSARLVSGDEALYVFTRDAVTGRLAHLQTLYASTDAPQMGKPTDLACSLDGRHVYTVSPAEDAVTIFARDELTGELSLVESVYADAVYAVTISPDGQFVYAAGSGNSILLYHRDAATGELTLADQADTLVGTWDLTLSQDGRFLYTSAWADTSVVDVFEHVHTVRPIEQTLAAGDIVSDADFGNARVSALSGQVFADVDNDGVHDAGENGANGWAVELIDLHGIVVVAAVTVSEDLDGDGVIDPATEAGWFTLNEILSGDYELRVVLPIAWTQSAPEGNYLLSLNGQTVTDLDFGVFMPASISGQVFADRHLDGVHDVGDLGQDGWTVELVDAATGLVVGATTTASIDLDGNGVIAADTEAGLYAFDSLIPGDYEVRHVLPAGWTQVAPIGSHLVSPTVGEDVTGVDFADIAYGDIEGQVFDDMDGNAGQDAGEPGMNGWTIELVDAATGDVVATTATADDDRNGDGAIDPAAEAGWYSFTDLPVARYFMRQSSDPAYVQTLPGPVSIYGEHDVTAADNATVSDVDFGVFALAAVEGQVFADLDYDGLQDADEDGLNTWTVELVDVGSGAVVDTAVTADVDVDGDGVIDPHTESGLYAFADVLPGSHEIRLIIPELWSQTYPAGLAHSYLPLSGQTQGGLDFGVASLPSIAGQVFYDSDGDGLHDGDENGLNIWTVELVDPSTGDVLATAITADRDIDASGTIDPIEEQGTYRFTDLLPGAYLVRQVAQNGWIQTTPAATTYTYIVDIAHHETEGDFGNYQPSSVSGQKWRDVDADGVRDDADVGLSEWTIELVDAATGLVVATTVTADIDLNTDGAINPMTEAGLYSFIDLPAGDYELREVQQAGWVQSWVEPLDVSLRVYSGSTALYDLETFEYYPYWLEGSHTDLNRQPGLWKVNDDVYANGALDRYNMPQYTPGGDPNVYWLIFEDQRTGEGYWQATGDMDFNDIDVKVVEDPTAGTVEATGYRKVSGYTFQLIGPDGTAYSESGGQIGPISIDTFPIYGAHAWTFSLANDQSIGGLDFSNFQGGGAVTGRHVNDLNANGVRDDGEVGLDGWTVEGVDPVSGRVVGSAVTGSMDLDGDGVIDPATEMGLYSLASMPAGTFDVRLVVPEGWAQTAPFGDTHTVTLAAGEAQSGFDFAAAELGMVSGQLFNDLDSSGVQDAGEFGINGWTVELVDTDTGLLIAATTSGGVDVNGDGTMDPLTEAGRYTFSGLSAGNYEMRLISPSGWTQTSPMAGPFSRLFAAGGSGGAMTIYEIDPTDGSALNSFAAPQAAINSGYQGLAVGPDSLFYVDANDWLTPTLWELDPDTGAVIDADPLTFGAIYVIKGLAYLDGLLYIQYMPDQVAVWDPASDAFVRTLTISAVVMGGLTGAGDLGVLFDSNAAGEIIAIDPTDGSVLNTFATGLGALDGGLAYAGGELLAVGTSIGSLVHRIDPSTGAVLGSFALGVTGSIVGLGGDYESPAEPAWRQIALATDEHSDGADYGYHSSNLRGDMDGDGDVDADDIDLLLADFGDAGRAGPQSDLDGDGDADQDDMDILVRNLVETSIGVGTDFGDANLDGLVDATDLAILKANFASQGVGWSGGDFNGSGLVNLTDLAILAKYFGFDASAATLSMGPPPASQTPLPASQTPPPAAPVQVTADTTQQAPAEVNTALASDVAATPIATSASLKLAPPPDVTDTLSTSAPAELAAADAGDEPMGVYEPTTQPKRRRHKRAGKGPHQSQPSPPVAARALQLSKGRDNGRKRTAPLPAQGATATTAPTPRSTRRRRGDDHLEDEFSILQIDALMKVNV